MQTPHTPPEGLDWQTLPPPSERTAAHDGAGSRAALKVRKAKTPARAGLARATTRLNSGDLKMIIYPAVWSRIILALPGRILPRGRLKGRNWKA
jgi:hypothetical protein